MTDLKTTTALVKSILEQHEQTRNSDNLLYLKVLEILGKQKGIDINSMPLPYYLANMKGMGFPPFESVRRSRQKVQEHHPDLAACDAVTEARLLNETVYREYAMGKV